MGIQWVVVVAAVLSCTLYTPEAKPVQSVPSAPAVDLDALSLAERQQLNRIWDAEIRKVPKSAGESTQFLKYPGQGRYIYGYTFNNGLQSHLQASDGKDRTLGKYAYKDAAGKDVEVHYVSGPGGYKVMTNNLPADTEEVRLAKEAFFKAFQARKALHEKQRMEKAGGISSGGVAVASAATLTSSRGRPMAAALKHMGNAFEEEDEDDEDSDGIDSSSESSSSSQSSQEEGDQESDEEGEEDDEEEGGEGGGEEDEDEEDEEDEDEEDGEDSSSSSSSSSASSQEGEEDEETLRAQFDENYGNRLFQSHVVYTGGQ